MADPVADMMESDDQKEHKVGSLGDLLLQLKWAKAARAKVESSARRSSETLPEGQGANGNNQFVRLLPGLVPSKPQVHTPNKTSSSSSKKSSNPSSKNVVGAMPTQPNVQLLKTKSKKAPKSLKQGSDSAKKVIINKGSEKKSSKKKSSKKKRK